MKKCTKGFFLADLEEKAQLLNTNAVENENAQVVLVGKELKFEADFNSKLAGELFFMHALSLARAVDLQYYPISIFAKFEKQNNKSTQKEIVTNANQATNALSKYIVKAQDEVLECSLLGFAQKEKNIERQR